MVFHLKTVKLIPINGSISMNNSKNTVYKAEMRRLGPVSALNAS